MLVGCSCCDVLLRLRASARCPGGSHCVIHELVIRTWRGHKCSVSWTVWWCWSWTEGCTRSPGISRHSFIPDTSEFCSRKLLLSYHSLYTLYVIFATQAMLSADYAFTQCLPICLSVSLCVTIQYCIKTAKLHIIVKILLSPVYRKLRI